MSRPRNRQTRDPPPGYKGLMVGHGFRHSAKTRLQEIGFQRDIIEAQLSHKVGGVEGKYWRDQHLRFLPERRTMMRAWAAYLDSLERPDELARLRAA